MKRFALMAAAVILLAGCEHSEGMGMEFYADPGISGKVPMDEISVIDYGALSPTHISTQVKVDAGRWIERNMNAYAEFDVLVDSCAGFAELSEEDYESVLTAVIAADLPNYTPPGPDSCEPLIGTQGTGVVYRDAEGEEFSFDSGPCELEKRIEDLRVVLMGLADLYVTDCSHDYFAGMFDGVAFDDDSDGFEEQEETEDHTQGQEETEDHTQDQEDDGEEEPDEAGAPPGAAE